MSQPRTSPGTNKIRGSVAGALLRIGFGLVIISLAVFASTLIAEAATRFSLEQVDIGLGTSDLRQTVVNAIQWVLGILGLVAVSFIIYGGFLWMTAAGNVQRIEKAKRVILSAVIGLVVVLLAWAIVLFVARTTGNLTGDSDGDGGPGCCLPPGDGGLGFEIRSITTDCGAPPDYDDDVFLCSAINITFNHLLNDATVKDAVESGQLVIKQCDDSITPGVTCGDSEFVIPPPPDGEAINAGLTSPDRQHYTPDTPTATKPEWVARSGSAGKSVTFHHVPKLFKANTTFRVEITKDIEDTNGDSIVACRQNLVTPVPGCSEDAGNNRFLFTMQTGTSVDTIPPRVQSSYPRSDYKQTAACSAGVCTTGVRSGQACSGANECPLNFPDQNVPREPTMSINYDQAILPVIDQSKPDPGDNTVAIIPFTPDDATPYNYEDGTESAPVNPADFIVVPGGNGQSFIIQMKPGKKLNEFTWYKVVVKGTRDLCSNLQSPDPFVWVFETNNVVAGIANHYPRDGTSDVCVDTEIFIQYTISMYDPLNDSCRVGLSGGGYVTRAKLTEGGAGVGNKVFDIHPNQDPLVQCTGGGPCPYHDLCKQYSVLPPPPYPVDSSKLLTPNRTYKMGVDNRFVVDDAGGTLRFGEGFTPPPPSLQPTWSFGTKPAGECINRPVITSINPGHGREGQCLTISGYNFDPNGNSRRGGDDLIYDATGGQPDTAWENSYITTKAPTGATAGSPGPHTYKVKVEFPAPYGVIESNAYNWTLDSGSPSRAACVHALVPSSGYPGSGLTIKGERFDPASTVKDINFSSFSPPATGWTDTEIDTSVPGAAANGPNPVSVTNDEGTSNAIDFMVVPVPSDVATVVDRWPSCTESCTNADVGARFSRAMDAVTITTANVILRPCTDFNCLTYSASAVATALSYDGTSNIVHFPQSGGMQTNRWYRAVLMKGIKASTGIELMGLNFDYGGTGVNNSFSWIFKTQSGAGGCSLDRAEIDPRNHLMRNAGEERDYRCDAYTDSNSCSSTGQLIDPTTLNYVWNTDPAFVMSAPAAPGHQTITAVNETVPGSTSVTCQVNDPPDPGTAQDTGNLIIDYSWCDETTDCQRGGQCPGSTCNTADRRCTPVLKSAAPSPMPVGGWTKLEGCYFGPYLAGVCEGSSLSCNSYKDCPPGVQCLGGSHVVFNTDKRGLWPDAGGRCGPPATQWTDNEIRSEVPDRDNAGNSATLGNGPLKVVRWDGAASNDVTFTVSTGSVPPGICRVEPDTGTEGTNVKIIGQEFGPSQEEVAFYDNGPPATAKSVATYISWDPNEIICRVPLDVDNNPGSGFEYPVGHPWGSGEVAVRRGADWSNVANFDVRSPDCTICAGNDAICGGGSSCGFNGCCQTNPRVIATSPTGMNVCRNIIMTASFDRPMHADSINSNTIRLEKDVGGTWEEVRPISVVYDAGANTARITAGLLDQNRVYRMIISLGNEIRSAAGARLAITSHTFKTADSPGPCEISEIEVSPRTWTFPKAGPTSVKNFTARAMSGGVELFPISGTYDWTWDAWRVNDGTIARISSNPSPQEVVIEALPKKGRTLVVAMAKPVTAPPPAGLRAPIYGTADISVTACEKPWPLGSNQFTDQAGNCSIIAGGCDDDYHFDISYCMDDASLPNLNYDGSGYRFTITGADPRSVPNKLLKDFLFKELNAGARDAIGLRIYDNTEQLSAQEWYSKFAPRPGATAPRVVDGYDAVIDGTTTYVAASNFDGSAITPKIYLLSYNQGASAAIVNIYNQMLQNWFLNNNRVGGICDPSRPPAEQESFKPCIQRDLKRLAGANDILEFSSEYKTKNGSYPKLEAGSFIANQSFSTWPSWQQTLGSAFGRTMPLDPKNALAPCPAQAQDGTCWNETDKSFICNAGSSILGFKAEADGSKVTVLATMEYQGTGKFSNITGLRNFCSSPSSCACFNYGNSP